MGKYWDMVMAFRLLFCYMLPLYFIFGAQYRCSSYFFRQKNRPGAFYAWPVFLLQHWFVSAPVSPPHGKRQHPDQKDWRKDPGWLIRRHPLCGMGHLSHGELYGITKSLYGFQIVWMISLYCLPFWLSRGFLYEFMYKPGFPGFLPDGILAV